MRAFDQFLYGNYRNLKFNDVWVEGNAFLADYKEFNSGIVSNNVSDLSAMTLWVLLSARYGNSTIASSDVNQFKNKVFALIFQYGPTWEKRLDIQKSIRELSLDELQKGGKAIYNTAFNPNQPVAANKGSANGEGSNTLEELTYINSQNTTNYKKSKVDAYAILVDLLETDVTGEFLDKFKKLFLTVVTPELPLWYVSDRDEEEDV